MNVLVIGAGVIGSYLTHTLCAAGNDVTIVARGSWGETLASQGLVIHHIVQHSTTIDHPKVVDEAPRDHHFDAAFSVMRQDQQLAALPKLAAVDCELLVLVGNDLHGNEIETYLQEHGKMRRLLFGFQSTAGSRETDYVECFRIGAAGLDVAPLHGEATEDEKTLLGQIFTGRYRPHWTHDFDDWLVCHAISIIPMCCMSYLCDCDLHKASGELISRTIAAMVEAYQLIEHLGYQILPESDRAFIRSRAKLRAWHVIVWLMTRTSIGTYCIDNHCKHAPEEMQSLAKQINLFRSQAPEMPMPQWDGLLSEMGGWEQVCQRWGENHH